MLAWQETLHLKKVVIFLLDHSSLLQGVDFSGFQLGRCLLTLERVGKGGHGQNKGPPPPPPGSCPHPVLDALPDISRGRLHVC